MRDVLIGPRVIRIAVILALVGATAVVVVQNGNARRQAQIAACRARYAAAKTAADTDAVDAWLLPNPGGRVQLWKRCGQYRRGSQL